jgi:hypothetical protein
MRNGPTEEAAKAAVPLVEKALSGVDGILGMSPTQLPDGRHAVQIDVERSRPELECQHSKVGSVPLVWNTVGDLAMPIIVEVPDKLLAV